MAGGIFQGGAVIDALAGRKRKKEYVSDPLQGQIDKTIGGFDTYRGDITRGLNDYEAGMKENVATQKRFAPMAEKEIGQVQGEVLGGNYMDDRDRLRSGDLNSLTNLLAQMGGGMSAADKTAAARLGYAGRSGGAYQDKARQAFLGAFASPLANTIYSGLNTGATAADAARRGKAGTVSALINERSKIPDRATDRMLAVPSARADFFGREIGALGDVGRVNKDNFMGVREEKNKWASAVGAMDESLNSTADAAISLYSMGAFDGMLGGGKGKGGGESDADWQSRIERAPNGPPAWGSWDGGFSAGVGYGVPDNRSIASPGIGYDLPPQTRSPAPWGRENPWDGSFNIGVGLGG